MPVSASLLSFDCTDLQAHIGGGVVGGPPLESARLPSLGESSGFIVPHFTLPCIMLSGATPLIYSLVPVKLSLAASSDKQLRVKGICSVQQLVVGGNAGSVSSSEPTSWWRLLLLLLG